MSIAKKFLRLIWRGWRARTRQIFYMCSRNVLKYSDFIFYAATIKNNKFNANLRFPQKIAQFQGFIDVRARGARQKFYEKFLQKYFF